MRMIFTIGVIAILVSVACSIALLGYKGSVTSEPTWVYLFKEFFKSCLTFVTVILGGIVANRVIENQRQRREDARRDEDIRRTILKEFADIYSDFYSIRKLYHSILEGGNSLYPKLSSDIVNDLLHKSVKLEGRFGSLKALAITHFGLSPEEMAHTKDEEYLVKRLKGL